VKRKAEKRAAGKMLGEDENAEEALEKAERLRAMVRSNLLFRELFLTGNRTVKSLMDNFTKYLKASVKNPSLYSLNNIILLSGLLILLSAYLVLYVSQPRSTS